MPMNKILLFHNGFSFPSNLLGEVILITLETDHLDFFFLSPPENEMIRDMRNDWKKPNPLWTRHLFEMAPALLLVQNPGSSGPT